LQNEIVLTLGGKKILLVHGHRHGVKQDNDRITYYAREKGVDAVFFGHGHWPVNEERGGVLIFSPGSPSWPRGGSVASYGIVEIGDEIKGEIFNI
jgi:putative phosphoesterase